MEIIIGSEGLPVEKASFDGRITVVRAAACVHGLPIQITGFEETDPISRLKGVKSMHFDPVSQQWLIHHVDGSITDIQLNLEERELSVKKSKQGVNEFSIDLTLGVLNVTFSPREDGTQFFVFINPETDIAKIHKRTVVDMV